MKVEVLGRAAPWLLAAIGVYAALVQLTLVFQNYPLEYREGAVLLTTSEFAHGNNPFAWSMQPVCINVYGVVHSLFLSPFVAAAPEFAAVTHRLASMLFMGASSGLIVWALRARGVSLMLAGVAGTIYYVQLLRTVLPVSRPDAMGLALFLASLIIPYACSFSTRSLILAAIAGVLAWLTKPYFALGVVTLSLYLLLGVSVARGLVFATAVGALAVAAGTLVDHMFPAFFYDTVLVNAGYGLNRDLAHLALQAAKFLYINGPLLLLAAVLLYRERTAISLHGDGQNSIARSACKWIGLFGLQIAVSCLALFKLAQNVGSTEYFFHLLTPVVLVQLFPYLARRVSPQLLLTVCVLQAMLYLPRIPVDYGMHWRAISAAVVSAHRALHAPPTVFLAVASRQQPYDSGQTEYFPAGLRFPHSMAAMARSRWLAFSGELERKIGQQWFDVVFTVPTMPFISQQALLESCYVRAQTLPAPMYYSRAIAVEVWKPRTHGCN